MICYKDITFCPYYLLCKTWQSKGCKVALTPDIEKDAEKWAIDCGFKDVPIAVYTTFPECFKRWFE